MGSDKVESFEHGALALWANRIAFSINGFGLAAWAPLVPLVKVRANVDERQLGLLLLCMGLGSIISMPLAGKVSTSSGCRNVIAAGVLGMCIALPLIALTSDARVLALLLFIFGASFGAEGVAMNMQATQIERENNKTMMSGFHGFYSLGGILGALVVSLLLAFEVTPIIVTTIVGTAMLVCLLFIWQGLLAKNVEKSDSKLAWPKGNVLIIGAVCFMVYLTEGAVLDWSAIFLTDFRKASPSEAGLGYAAFALAMTIGRFSGDRVTRKYGRIAVAMGGALLASLGFFVSTNVSSEVWIGLIGFFLIGLGCSNIVPIMYSLIGRQTAVPQSVAIPSISTMGYTGILVGPSVIGFVAHSFGLNIALIGLSVFLIVVMALIAAIKD